MAEDTPDDDQKTEEPTARRLQKAREDGQVPRSQELGIAAVMISSMAFLYLSGGWLIGHLSQLFASGFVIERRDIFSPYVGLMHFRDIGRDGFLLIIPLLLVTFIIPFSTVKVLVFAFVHPVVVNPDPFVTNSVSLRYSYLPKPVIVGKLLSTNKVPPIEGKITFVLLSTVSCPFK